MGWSQQETADKINGYRGQCGLDPGGIAGMTAPHLSEYENWPGPGATPVGRRPTLYLLATLAAIYGCEIAELVDDADREHLSPADLFNLDAYAAKRPSPESTDASFREHRSGAAWRPGQAPGLRQAELLRQELTDLLSGTTVAQTTLDDWDSAVARYGRASRERPMNVLLDDLTADLAELGRSLRGRGSASTVRRLAFVTAEMSGLMCLAYCRLDDRPAFRLWARTARLAASEADDPGMQAWVLAQEAHGHYYAGDMREAVEVAAQAQAVASGRPCVGGALAASLEARARAALGDRASTLGALARAEDITAQLDGDALAHSALGYNEAQLRFHAGSAYTRLGDVKAAFREQELALRLCQPGNYTDWALTRLDRAACLAMDGQATEAFAYATETIRDLTEAQRTGIINARAREIVLALPEGEQRSPGAQEFRQFLTEIPTQKEESGC